ncbi:hypothetical protein [Shewanella algae]|uniref:hypothetical protein n=1 Tax=Shewanella algae TaxID=38313 RepID=UPI00300791DA
MIKYLKYFAVPLFVTCIFLSALSFNSFMAWIGGAEFKVISQLFSLLANIATIIGACAVFVAVRSFIQDKRLKQLDQLKELISFLDKRLQYVLRARESIKDILTSYTPEKAQFGSLNVKLELYLAYHNLEIADDFNSERASFSLKHIKQTKLFTDSISELEEVTNKNFVVKLGEVARFNVLNGSDDGALEFYERWTDEQMNHCDSIRGYIDGLRKLEL